MSSTTVATHGIDITDTAVAQIRSIQERENLASHVLRISVVGGGCSGMTYRMGFIEAPGAQDQVIEKGGVRVCVDPRSAMYLSGTVIDFQDGLNGKGFTFQNPQAKRSCGCGSSFST
jgi:iron-sulfur cluster assembly protein